VDKSKKETNVSNYEFFITIFSLEICRADDAAAHGIARYFCAYVIPVLDYFRAVS